jgi:sugar transferase (PEP-CTERM/EpsH1 system associated)
LTLLFLANRFPYPPHRGDKLKIYNLAKRLSANHRLILVTFTETKEDLAHIHALDGIFDKVVSVHLPAYKSFLSVLMGFFSGIPFQVLYFRDRRLRKVLREVINSEKPDAVHVQHLRMSQYINELKDVPAIIDLPDAFSLYWERRVQNAPQWFQRVFAKWELSRVVSYEKKLAFYQRCFVCSEEDKLHLERLHGLKNLYVFPNGVDLDTFSIVSNEKDYASNEILLFTGNMNYAPNVDAVIYFTQVIFPIILERHPSVRFVIAGQKPLPSVVALASDKVEVTGFVEDIAIYYKDASVVVAPLRFGAGTQNKVLEALAMGVPVVCTAIGFEGLGIKSGQGAFKEIEALAFANRVCELLDSAALREKTGKEGMQIIRTRFDWNVLSQQLENHFKDIVSEKY